jgi:AraC-like DNA-binding protein
VKYYQSNEVTEENPRNWMPHLHDNIEIYILLEGDVSFAVESSNYKLTPGDAIITKPNEMHNCILNTKSVHRHLCFWFDITSSFIFGDFIKHDFGKGNLIRADEKSKARLLEIYSSLAEATDKNDCYAQFYLTLEMLGILKKFISLDNEIAESLSLDNEISEPLSLMKEILLDIDKNFKSIKNLEYFTVKYYLSQSTLYRMFKENLNTTPKLYIETKKLAYSRKLLKSGKNVTEACMESGFSDVSNYIRLFKKRFAVTPKEYRGK